MLKELPKQVYKKEQVLHSYKKELETENGFINLRFKLIRLTEEQLESFQGVLIPDSFNCELLVIQKHERIDTVTGEVTTGKWGVCDHMGYIMELMTNYFYKKELI